MKSLNRRQFIHRSALSFMSLWLPLACTSRSIGSKNPNKIGVALLGLGSYAGGQLAPALQMTKHCYLAGIVTGTPAKIPRWQRKYGIPDEHVYTYDTMADIANDDAIDVIYVVTPTGTHARFAIEAAATGKHVWCEKPMAMNVAECQSMIDACRKNKVQMTIGYRMQHEPNTRTLMSYADNPPFGAITRVDAQAGYAGGGGTGWRFEKEMGGGALYDMGVYTVNGIRYTTDRYPTRVLSARQYTNRPELFKEVDETTEYVLEFSDGLKAYGKTSVGESMNLLKATCEEGWYQLSPMQSYSGVEGERSDGVKLNKKVRDQQARQIDDDALALLEGRDLLVPPEDGLKDIRIIEAITESAAEGQVVTI
jgi:glucose-fructose oxidoreductase